MAEADEFVPPAWLTSQAGPGSFTEIGRRWARSLIELCGLEPDERVLDLGCGAGRLAIPLTRYLSPQGHYDGLDVLPWAIDWCRSEISSRYPNFTFTHADVASGQYYPDGAIGPEQYTLPYEAGRFDVVCGLSLFTHMLADGVTRYLAEIARTLREGGRTLLTFYLLNDEARQAIEGGRTDPMYRFENRAGAARITYEDAPEYIVGYDEAFVVEACAAAGLRVRQPVFHGRWAGREGALSWQDVVVADVTRAAAG